jgi:hypothetical protein
MLPTATYAIYCLSVEDAAEIAEVIQPHAPRLFIIVDEQESNNSIWMHPRDAVLFIKSGVDGSKAAAVRCAMLFAPSYLVAFIDGTTQLNITTEDAAQLVTDANKDGYAIFEQHWAISKLHAVENGFPGSTFVTPPSPDNPNLTTDDLVSLLVDLVPMFEVCFVPAVATEYKNIRLALERHIASYETDAPSAYFVTKPEEVNTAREKIKITGKVVCLNGGPDDFEREITYENGTVRLYSALQRR